MADYYIFFSIAFLIILPILGIKITKDYLFYYVYLSIFILLILIPYIVLISNNRFVLINGNVSRLMQFSETTIDKVNNFTFLILISFSLGYILLRMMIGSRSKTKYALPYNYQYIVFVTSNIFSFCANIVIFLVSDRYSGLLIFVMGYFSYLIFLAGYIFMLGRIKIRKKQRIILMLNMILFLYVNLYMNGGVRVALIGLLGSLLIGKIVNLITNNKIVKINFRKKVGLGILGLSLFHFSVIFQYVRWNIYGVTSLKEAFKLIFLSNKEAYLTSLLKGDLMYFYKAAVHTFEVIPGVSDYIYGDTYIRLLFFFVPHSLFPTLKPEETQLRMSAILNPESYLIGQSLPPSIIGDLYWNFGYYGPLVAFFLGGIILLVQRQLNRERDSIMSLALGSTIFVVILLYIRGTFNGMYYFYFILFYLIIGKCVYTILKTRINN